jgi:hypothetical protein
MQVAEAPTASFNNVRFPFFKTGLEVCGQAISILRKMAYTICGIHQFK